MAILSWINDQELISNVNQLLEKAKTAKKNSQLQFGKNVIDPFSALFEITGFDLDYNTWHTSETARQAQKTLQNHIGDFHQKILGSCANWKNLGTGNVIDLVNDNQKIIAEIKNKYNTLSGGKLSDLYNSLDSLVMQKNSIYKNYTAYYVTIIPKKPIRQDIPFMPSDKQTGQKCALNQLIREIDGASFYELATGQKFALKNLYDSLPPLITTLTGKKISETKKLANFFKEAYN